MTEKILFGEDARQAIAIGVNKICNAVKVTLGSSGRNVILGNRYVPRITKDGVSVATGIELEDETESIGANIIKETAKRTAQQAGDGTSTSCVLAQSIFIEGLKLISSGTNSVELKKGIDYGVQIVVEELKKISQPIDNDFEKIKSVATISANNDAEIGTMISDAFKKIGTGGILTLEESPTYKSYIELAKGFHFDRGYISQVFKNKTDLSCEFNNPAIVIYQDTITSFTELFPVLEMTCASPKPIPLVVICEGLQGEAIMGVVSNVAQRKLPVCFITSPGFGESKNEILKDIAILTGATVLNEEFGVRLDGITKSHFGSCEKIKVKRDETIIFGGKGNEKELQQRIEETQKQIELSQHEYEEKMHIERLAKLTNSIGVFYVGATTQIEMKEKKDRVEDAILATKSAIEEGVVAGGGSTLLRISNMVNLKLNAKSDSFLQGFLLLINSLSSPIKQICFNCGVDEEKIMSSVLESNDNFGYNSKTEQIENLVESGVIDPTKVVRVALENAASVAGTLLTTEVLTVDVPNLPQRQN